MTGADLVRAAWQLRTGTIQTTGADLRKVPNVPRYDNDGDAAEAARYLEIPLGLVQAAIAYYGVSERSTDEGAGSHARPYHLLTVKAATR